MPQRTAGTALVMLLAAWVSFSPNGCALCVSKGKLYAKTSIEQEFSNAALVIRGGVIRLSDIQISGPDEEFGIRYEIHPLRSFKGRPPSIMYLFTRQDSGGFYLDVGSEYLLFLRPISPDEWAPEALGAVVVNYNCGQSRLWAAVSASDRRLLSHLSEK
jgi:hypothetical protein